MLMRRPLRKERMMELAVVAAAAMAVVAAVAAAAEKFHIPVLPEGVVEQPDWAAEAAVVGAIMVPMVMVELEATRVVTEAFRMVARSLLKLEDLRELARAALGLGKPLPELEPAAVVAEDNTDSSRYQHEFVLVQAVAVVETMTMVLFPDSRAETGEASFLSLLTLFPTAEPLVQMVAMAFQLQVETGPVEVVQEAVF
jgi:hypothetical protein